MKRKLKLLRQWKDATGKSFNIDDIIEVEDDVVTKDLLFDGTAEYFIEPQVDLKQIIAEAIQKEIKPIQDKLTHISIHDKSDDDPGFGYLPERIDNKWTKSEKICGLGMFARDVARASSPSSRTPEKLIKCQERSVKMINKAISDGLVEKSAGEGMTAGEDSEGGFLIPPEFSTMLMESSLESAVIRPRASILSIGSNRIELPQVINYTHTSNVYGGLTASWKGEEAEMTGVKAALEEVALNLHKLTIMSYASDEIIKFSPTALGSWFLPKMAEAVTWKEEDGFINGTGAGQPLGLNNAGSILNIVIETGQTLAASAVVTDNLLKMYQRAHVERSGSLVWLYNRNDLFYWLCLLKIAVGAGGSHVGLVQQMPGSPQLTILGLPLVDTEHCKAAGTQGDIILTDLSQYIIADHRSGAAIAQSDHLKFDYAQTAYRIIRYVDGQPRYKSVFTRQNSTNTAAQVMRIATRS